MVDAIGRLRMGSRGERAGERARIDCAGLIEREASDTDAGTDADAGGLFRGRIYGTGEAQSQPMENARPAALMLSGGNGAPGTHAIARSEG